MIKTNGQNLMMRMLKNLITLNQKKTVMEENQIVQEEDFLVDGKVVKIVLMLIFVFMKEIIKLI